MKSFRNSLGAAMSVGFVLAGVALFFSAAGPQILSVEQTRQVTGGTINGVRLIYTNCAAASATCTFGLCNQQTHQCPANTAERYQVSPTYPYGTAAGSDWATTIPANYLCNRHRFCSIQCSQSTQAPFLWYCGASVGPIVDDPPVAGAQGGQPFRQEA